MGCSRASRGCVISIYQSIYIYIYLSIYLYLYIERSAPYRVQPDGDLEQSHHWDELYLSIPLYVSAHHGDVSYLSINLSISISIYIYISTDR